MLRLAFWVSVSAMAAWVGNLGVGPAAMTAVLPHSPLAPVTCASLGLDPVVPHSTSPSRTKRILERFYSETDGVGGLGCWVHPHLNGKDYVITPHSWGAEPNEDHRGLIDEAFESQTAAYDSLSVLGTLDVGLYILLTDLDGNAEAHWIQDNQCWIEAGPSAGFGTYPRDWFQETLAHEIGHCFIMENVPGATLETYSDGADNWWDESGAEFFGSVIYPGRDFEHINTVMFDMDGLEFFQAYYAVVLLQHYANQTSNRAVLDLLIGFHGAATSANALRDHIDGAGLDALFHDFGLTHYQGMVADPGGGYMLAEDVVVSYVQSNLTPPGGIVTLDSLPPRRLNVVDLSIPEAHDAVLRIGGGVDETFLASAYVDGAMRTSWTGGIEVRGECQSTRNVPVFLTTLRRTGVRDIEVEYELFEDQDCEDETSMIAACQGMPALPVCMVGTWRMLDEDITGMLGVDSLIPVSGGVYTRFLENGAFIHRFDALEVESVSLDRFGKMKMEIRQRYSGDIRGCSEAVDAPRRDGASPLQTSATSDRVVRHTYIRHAGRTGNERREDGLQAYHWPNTSTYARCEGDQLWLGQREYTRSSR